MARWRMPLLLLAAAVARASVEENNPEMSNLIDKGEQKENCGIKLYPKQHFEIMEKIDAKYEAAIDKFCKALKKKNFDGEMLKNLISSRGAAERAIFHMGHVAFIPAGIDLGGYSIVPMPNSMLFLHRMKLRNQTNFRINYLNNLIAGGAMVLNCILNLNDLHLYGSYNRASVGKNPFNLIFKPAYGELQILLKNVRFDIFGTHRLVQNRLTIEHTYSFMFVDDVLVTFVNSSSDCNDKPERIPEASITAFKEKLLADLNTWLKDYFNDYLLTRDMTPLVTPELEKYEQERTLALNEYVDLTLATLKHRLYSLKPPAADVKIPSVTLFTPNGVVLKLTNGILRGLDTFYRRSVATGRSGKNEGINDVRRVFAIIGFHKLKLEFNYEAHIPGTPVLFGLIVLTADDLVAQFAMSLKKNPLGVEIAFAIRRSSRPETMVVEGELNRRIANFRYVLEEQLMTLMIHKMWFQIKQLATLTKCVPNLHGYEDPGDTSDELKRHGLPADPIVLTRNDSIEVVVPPESGEEGGKAKKLHIKYEENVRIDEVGKSEDKTEEKDTSFEMTPEDSRRKSKHHKPNQRKRSKHGNNCISY